MEADDPLWRTPLSWSSWQTWEVTIDSLKLLLVLMVWFQSNAVPMKCFSVFIVCLFFFANFYVRQVVRDTKHFILSDVKKSPLIKHVVWSTAFQAMEVYRLSRCHSAKLHLFRQNHRWLTKQQAQSLESWTANPDSAPNWNDVCFSETTKHR